MGKMKRIPKPFIKIKRLSRRKKMILLGHEIKKHIRWKWERDKMHATLEAITMINLNTLRITANPDIDYIKGMSIVLHDTLRITTDPDIDMNYIKGMSTISIYDHNYRSPVQENISGYIRPDVMRKLSDLDISDENEANSNADTPQLDIGHDILHQTSYLRIRDNNEPDINERIKNIIVSENVNM